MTNYLQLERKAEHIQTACICALTAGLTTVSLPFNSGIARVLGSPDLGLMYLSEGVLDVYRAIVGVVIVLLLVAPPAAVLCAVLVLASWKYGLDVLWWVRPILLLLNGVWVLHFAFGVLVFAVAGLMR